MVRNQPPSGPSSRPLVTRIVTPSATGAKLHGMRERKPANIVDLTGNTLFVDGGSHINGSAWAPDLD